MLVKPRRNVAVAVACAASALLAAPALAATPHVVRQLRLASSYVEGIAALGSHYSYIGTSTSNTMYVVRTPGLQMAAHWVLPSGGLDSGMERLALSPDGHWLFVLNKIADDVLVIDTTGGRPTVSLALANAFPRELAVSANGRYLYVSGGQGVDVYDLSTGALVGNLFPDDPVTSAAPAPNGTVYVLGISSDRQAQLRAYGPTGGGGQVLASWGGQLLAEKNGSLAISPNGRRLYALYDGLRAFATSGRMVGRIALPFAPAFTGIAVAPNGRQAMLWAPDFSASGSVTTRPGYYRNEFGFVSGGVVAVDLQRMRPIRARLGAITTPRQVVYSSDSRYAFVTEIKRVDEIATGTSGRDGAHYPAISLRNPVGGGTVSVSNGTGGTGGTTGGGGTGGTSGGSGGTSGGSGGTSGGSGGTSGGSGGTSGGGGGTSCGAWNVSGSWTWQNNGGGSGPANGPATLSQSGTSLSGTVTDGSGTWTLSGSISGATVSLSMTPPTGSGLIGVNNYSGTVSSDGTRIVGSNYGNFTGGHATCTG